MKESKDSKIKLGTLVGQHKKNHIKTFYQFDKNSIDSIVFKLGQALHKKKAHLLLVVHYDQ